MGGKFLEFGMCTADVTELGGSELWQGRLEGSAIMSETAGACPQDSIGQRT